APERWRILGGKALGCFLTILMLASVVLLVGRLGFGVRPASFPLLVASLLSISFAFVGVMMAISTLGKTQAAVSGLGWAILMMMNMTGGGMVPLAFMPAWMQSAGSVSPVKWAILSLEGSMWRGFSAEQMLLPCGILLAVGAVGLTIGVRAFRWNEA
ncbi:MAG: ABC transporter permease, partial [Candidatus Eisenbacteria bacterium]|nr:ABC transporter permease [Candidatus Eisenbacteria bacterium]